MVMSATNNNIFFIIGLNDEGVFRQFSENDLYLEQDNYQ